MSVAGNYSTPFWGSIDKKVSERQRETKYGVDVSANLEMGKFLPEASGVKVPMYVGFSERSAIRSSIRSTPTSNGKMPRATSPLRNARNG
ncbi:MAG: hypothetical protein IPI41_18110 [Flavobacteriales bacterium]|nr:hypothetical protein [Flavobacteriales bacterium]